MDPSNRTEDLALWRELRKLDSKFLKKIERFYILGDKCSSAILICKDQRVYASGLWTKTSTPKEITNFRGTNIIDISENKLKVFLMIEKRENNVLRKNLYSMQKRRYDAAIKCEILNVEKYHCYNLTMIAVDRDNVLWHSILDRPPKRFEPPIYQSEKIIHLARSSKVSLFLTNKDRLYLWTTRLFLLITPYTRCNKIKKLISFGDNEFLFISDEDLLYHYSDVIENSYCPVYQIETGGPILDVYGSPSGYIIVRADGTCWVWDCYYSRMIKTNQRSIPDVYCLNLENSTPLITWLPPELSEPSALESLGTFNQFTKSDVIFEVRFSNHIITMQRSTLICYSEYFRKKFEKQWRKLDSIFLEKFGYAPLYEYFRFIHTGKFKSFLTSEILAEIYAIANEFEDDNIRELIPGYIYDRIFVSNNKRQKIDV